MVQFLKNLKTNNNSLRGKSKGIKLLNFIPLFLMDRYLDNPISRYKRP